MKKRQVFWSFCFMLILFTLPAQTIPLQEHPRPDFQRSSWMNLNGPWAFRFDPQNLGLQQNWPSAPLSAFYRQIMVPFPWGSPLSGVPDSADIAWYSRSITLPDSWQGLRIFLVIGASDWETSAWINGRPLGSHQGGYMPFEFELTPQATPGKKYQLTLRADDVRRDFTLYGKQGYGNARGIWQTVYLEARPAVYLEHLHFTPDIETSRARVTAYFSAATSLKSNLTLHIPGVQAVTQDIPAGKTSYSFDVHIPNARLWSLEDPYLYDVDAQWGQDRVQTYFGMRKISVVDLPGSTIPYIALNNKPVYLQLALDQCYHPDGYYTFPSDQFMKEEILRSKSIGLNGIRTHIKPELPRKLYWADKLGLLVMADLPNSWGEPDENMRRESENTLREMIHRDYNHPSIFSWVVFNETWGLTTKLENQEGKPEYRYLPATQHWVASMYYLAKSLDGTRLVEDNSICCGRGHTETDIYSWHEYLPGWLWEEHLANVVKNNFPGSQFHFEAGFKQDRQPNINSECGNVWGYEGSTGDVDWSWDYHRMINTFRKYPQVAGWLYTEHHDVINEWNGYWRYDRSEKETGVGEIVPGMTLNDFHAPFYLSTGNEIARTVPAGSIQEVPLFSSFMTDRGEVGSMLTLNIKLSGITSTGETKTWLEQTRQVPYQPWQQKPLEPLSVTMPDEKAVAYLSLTLTSKDGQALHHNFMIFEVEKGTPPDHTIILDQAPAAVFAQQWSIKHWSVLDGKKVNGAGQGYFEYRIPVPKTLNLARMKEAYFLAEVSAKELFAKDRDGATLQNVNYMLGGQVEPSKNPNAYPMTDETKFPSMVTVLINGQKAGSLVLPDDPADHRGVLSWHHQLKDKKLREAGSYGYLLKTPITKSTLKVAQKTGYLSVRLNVEGKGGLAVYGEDFGRYPFNPSVVLKEK